MAGLTGLLVTFLYKYFSYIKVLFDHLVHRIISVDQTRGEGALQAKIKFGVTSSVFALHYQDPYFLKRVVGFIMPTISHVQYTISIYTFFFYYTYVHLSYVHIMQVICHTFCSYLYLQRCQIRNPFFLNIRIFYQEYFFNVKIFILSYLYNIVNFRHANTYIKDSKKNR